MWVVVALLALGTFAIGTDGFVIAGVLPEIGRELHVSASAAGQLVTVFSWVYALSAPIIASSAGRIARRSFMLTAMAIFVAANLLAATAGSYGVLVAARVIAAVAASAFTATASVAAAGLASEERRGRALSVVLAGISAATVVGVPIGTYVAGLGSFRSTFWLVTGLGLIVLAGLAWRLPALPAPRPVDLRTRLSALKLPGVLSTLAVTTLAMTCGFTVYTYIAPFLQSVLAPSRETFTALLLVFGLGGAVGNILSGVLTDRWGAFPTTVSSLAIVTVVVGTLPWLASSLPTAFLGVFVWNCAGWLLVAAQQHRLMGLAPHAGPLVIALNASALYVGIGGAGLLGGVIVPTLGPRALAPSAAAAELLALCLYLTACAPRR